MQNDSLEDLKVYSEKRSDSQLELAVVQPVFLFLISEGKHLTPDGHRKRGSSLPGGGDFWGPDSFRGCQFSVSHRCQGGKDACEM